MAVEIKKLGPRMRPDYNWAVFKDGVHVDALVTLMGDPTETWRLWKDDIEYTDDERAVINGKVAQLNNKG